MVGNRETQNPAFWRVYHWGLACSIYPKSSSHTSRGFLAVWMVCFFGGVWKPCGLWQKITPDQCIDGNRPCSDTLLGGSSHLVSGQ